MHYTQGRAKWSYSLTIFFINHNPLRDTQRYICVVVLLIIINCMRSKHRLTTVIVVYYLGNQIQVRWFMAGLLLTKTEQ